MTIRDHIRSATIDATMAVRYSRRKLLDPANRTVLTSLRLTTALRDQIQAYADRERLTLRGAIETLLERGLGLSAEDDTTVCVSKPSA